MTMWWPHPDDMKDLKVEENPEGVFYFSAPEGSECARWLDSFNQKEELRKEFNEAILKAILAYIKKDEECGST
jgi:hypothetical protein